MLKLSQVGRLVFEMKTLNDLKKPLCKWGVCSHEEGTVFFKYTAQVVVIPL